MHVGYRNEGIRPVNEMKMRARWKLGRALAVVERGQGTGKKTDLTSDAGREFFAQLPSAESLMPRLDAAQIKGLLESKDSEAL